MDVCWRQNYIVSEKLGLWVTEHTFVKKYGVSNWVRMYKNMGSLGECDAKNGDLNSLTYVYVSPPEPSSPFGTLSIYSIIFLLSPVDCQDLTYKSGKSSIIIDFLA